MMEAHRWTSTRLSPGWAQQTIRHLNRIHLDLADMRHMLENHDQGVTDDPCAMAAREIATCLPELEAAARWLEELT